MLNRLFNYLLIIKLQYITNMKKPLEQVKCKLQQINLRHNFSKKSILQTYNIVKHDFLGNKHIKTHLATHNLTENLVRDFLLPTLTRYTRSVFIHTLFAKFEDLLFEAFYLVTGLGILPTLTDKMTCIFEKCFLFTPRVGETSVHELSNRVNPSAKLAYHILSMYIRFA